MKSSFLIHFAGVYLAAVNITAFVTYAADKRLAVKHMRRISEKTLMTLAASGGALGALLSMEIFRHKTKHPKFYIGVPALLVIQAALLFFFLRFTYN